MGFAGAPQYTVWSRGRLLGHSDLSYVRCIPKVRTGDFFPTEIGQKLMPLVTGVRAAFLGLLDMTDDRERMTAHLNERRRQLRSGSLACSPTEDADVAAAQAQFEALELELRAPNGQVVRTTDIHIRDNEVTLAFADLDDDLTIPDPLFAETDEEKQVLADMEHDEELLAEWFGPDWDDEVEDKPWEPQPEFPRYQIFVDLVDEADIP